MRLNYGATGRGRSPSARGDRTRQQLLQCAPRAGPIYGRCRARARRAGAPSGDGAPRPAPISGPAVPDRKRARPGETTIGQSRRIGPSSTGIRGTCRRSTTWPWPTATPGTCGGREPLAAVGQLDSRIPQLYYGLQSAQLLAGSSRVAPDPRSDRPACPDNPLLLVEVQDASAQQDWEGAERRAEATSRSKQGDTLQLVDAFEQMAGIVMTQGRLQEAERTGVRSWRSRPPRVVGPPTVRRAELGWLRLRFRGTIPRARSPWSTRLWSDATRQHLPADRPYGELARFFAAAGETQRARAMMALAQKGSLEGRRRDAEHAWTEGVILLAEGRAGESEARLREAAEALAVRAVPAARPRPRARCEG